MSQPPNFLGHGYGERHAVHCKQKIAAAATRYWRIRTILEIIKFTAWALFFTLWTLTHISWGALSDLF